MELESTQRAAFAVSFSVGQRFRSFGELEDKLKRYEGSTFTKFWKRDCRTVEAARRRMDRPLADCIKGSIGKNGTSNFTNASEWAWHVESRAWYAEVTGYTGWPARILRA